MTLLDIVLFLPLVGFLLLLLMPRSSNAAAWTALGDFADCVCRFAGADRSVLVAVPAGYTFVTDTQWISYPPIRYHVALDGLSLWLVLLTTLLTPIAVLVSWNYIDNRVKEFYAFLILLEFGLIGVFVVAGSVPVLRVLGSVAGADVFPDRHLGTRAPHLRGREILPVHHGRIGADAGRDHLSLQPHRHVRLRRDPEPDCRPASACSSTPRKCCCSWRSS